MLIEKDGIIDNEVNTVLLTDDRMITLDDDQFFQITSTDKRLELWQGKNDYLSNNDSCGLKRICYWNKKSVIMFYQAG